MQHYDIKFFTNYILKQQILKSRNLEQRVRKNQLAPIYRREQDSRRTLYSFCLRSNTIYDA